MTTAEIFKNYVNITDSLRKGNLQRGGRMFYVLTEWLNQVCRSLRMDDKVFSLTCNILHRYHSNVVISNEDYQITGMSCLYIACIIMGKSIDTDDIEYTMEGDKGKGIKFTTNEIIEYFRADLIVPYPRNYISLIFLLAPELENGEYTEKILKLCQMTESLYSIKAYNLAMCCVILDRILVGYMRIEDIPMFRAVLINKKYFFNGSRLMSDLTTIVEELHKSRTLEVSKQKEFIELYSVLHKLDGLRNGKDVKITSNAGKSKTLSRVNKTRYQDMSGVKLEEKNILGGGTYGKVYKAKVGKSMVAVKVQRDEESYHLNLSELFIMTFLKNKNIQTIKEFSLGEENVTLIMTKQPKTLDMLIYGKNKSYVYSADIWESVYKHGIPSPNQLDLQTRRNLSEQLLSGVAYIHSMGILHLDIKPQNILVSPSGVLKIADFGLSAPYTYGISYKNQYNIHVFTMPYRAPELIIRDNFLNEHKGNIIPPSFTYGSETDVWATACVLLEIELGCIMAYSYVLDQIIYVLGEYPGYDKYKYHNDEVLPAVKDLNFKHLLLQMLSYNTSARITASQALALI